MTFKIKDQQPTSIKLEVEASSQDLTLAKQQAIKELAPQASIPGFRDGSKAPSQLIETHLNPNVLTDRVLNTAVNNLLGHIIAENHYLVVSQPEVEVMAFVPYEQLKFKVTLEIMADVQLGQYQNLNIPIKSQQPIEKDVNEVLDQIRNRQAKLNDTKSTKIKAGQLINLDFEGRLSSTKKIIEGGSATNYDLVIGSKSFIPGFEEQLIGLNVGQEKTFEITFPKDYFQAELKSKKASFKVKINSIKDRELPELNDEFARSAGPFTNLNQLKEQIKKELTDNFARQALNDFEDQLLQKILDNTTVSLPKSLVEEEYKTYENQQKQNALYQSQTWQEYLKNQGLTETEFQKKAQLEAEKRVKIAIVLGEIAKREAISVSKADFDAYLKKLSVQYKDNPEMLSELKQSNNQQILKNRLLFDITLSHLVELNKPQTKVVGAQNKKTSSKK